MTLKKTPWLVGALLAAVASASQAAFPDKTITILMPFAAGSTTDINARDFGPLLEAVTKQSVIVLNKVGAEGAIAGRDLKEAAGDGATMMFTSSSLPVLDPLMKKDMPYDAQKDFAPICTVARTSNVMYTTAANPLKTVADVVAAAKAAPGKLSFAYTSSNMRLAAVLFEQSMGIKLTEIPYKSSVTALTDVGGGQVDLIFIDHISAAAFVSSGKVRPLAVAGPQRWPSLPDVPSATEAGAPGFNVKVWFGLFAPGKTPPAVLAQVQAAVIQAMKTPQMAANLEKRGLQPMVICGDAMAKFQADEIALWKGVVKKAGIEPQ